MKINTKFNIDQKIYIKELKIWGTIISIVYTTRLEYFVRYFNDFEPKNIYFLENELQENESNDTIGFSLKPDKNVKVPKFDKLSEGCDPKLCKE
jgi:hypothetical protein